MDDRREHLLVICGPTATGKTDLAITLARHVGGEIVNAENNTFSDDTTPAQSAPEVDQ